ncbi:hypothetical protein J7T55_005687 [Diaporthe amygdali]|uniref:uncharacterized protein n=1 Tax=Phomopsis amygdali TaxID=1214568 RepID=UPI0022FE6E96|nr:uncharacterized protein J7T55_005687 [Diaporthe amygdali]KAJ0124349.1 hypothetical protein J7T55_005687 [Diaporthe amygdali]
MLPEGKTIFMALLLAYCAAAAPAHIAQPVQVQGVIDALKAQLKADNIPDAPAIVDEAEAALKANGALNAETIARLNDEIQARNRTRSLVLTNEGGSSVESIAKDTIEYLISKGVIQKPDHDVAGSGAVVLDAEVVKHVLISAYTCPDGSQAKWCCVIL